MQVWPCGIIPYVPRPSAINLDPISVPRRYDLGWFLTPIIKEDFGTYMDLNLTSFLAPLMRFGISIGLASGLIIRSCSGPIPEQVTPLRPVCIDQADNPFFWLRDHESESGALLASIQRLIAIKALQYLG